MTETLPSSPAPDAPINSKTTLNRLEAQFGDGYSQRASYGLNAKVKNLVLNWTNITVAERDILNDFFEDHADGTAFYYTLPNELTARKFIVMEYEDTYVSSSYCSYAATLKEVFDI